ncbi:E3 UFM1-protein ligase [Parasponia andersonii]|uniref:E3 UFM1-protein ligase n=1 Tax=Parasponia andersonii TaxID=3476 RepID=A0A2P5D109_PARAD|nr:E3 UFM1-protein ligase [Parasponia andersonii]
MDDELAELQRQFEFAQQAKSSIRLSERNVVELVQKLHQLHIIDFDLLHTVSGKEYITPEQLRHEILTEIKKLGRVSLIDLADTVGVDLYYVEKQAHQIVSDEPGLMLIQGEVISQSYWDNVAEEVNDRLQECSQIALAELAAQLLVGSELIASILEPRLGTLVKGRLEGGQLYTPAYVARVSAMVRGASRGITVPTNLTVLWSSLQQLLQEMDGTNGVVVDSSFFQSIFNGLLKEGEILGSLRAGVHWTPNVFAVAQKESVDSFFSQNSFISYEVLQNLGIPQPIQYLKSRYPEGTALVDVFVHPSLIEMLDAATEDALERSSWIGALSVLPASFGSQNASKLLSLCPSVQLEIKSNKAVIFGESYLFSNGFLKDVYGRLEKDMETFCVSGSSGVVLSNDLSDIKVGHDSSRFTDSSETVHEMSSNKQATEKGSKKKRGKSSGTAAAASVTEISVNTQENFAAKSKKGQRKGKDTSSLQVSDSKSAVKKESVKPKEDNNNIPSEEWVMQKISVLVPDFEEQGLLFSMLELSILTTTEQEFISLSNVVGIDDLETVIRPLANYLRPKLVDFWKQKRKALFTENAEKMKSLLDNLQKKLDESFLNMQLYEKALDLFEDDQSTSKPNNLGQQVILHRHLLRTTAAAIADTLIHNLDLHNKLKNGVEVEESQNSDSVSLTPGERITISKSFPGSLSNMALAVVEALEGKRVETFMTALRAIAEESGLILRKLDKKLERTLLHSYRKDLTSQVSAETDPVSLLPKVVSLLYIQLHHKALQAPGRAISVAITRLKDKLDDSTYKILTDYQAATVTLLALISAATGDEEDCTSDRILSRRELLEDQMAALKGLVLSSSQS